MDQGRLISVEEEKPPDTTTHSNEKASAAKKAKRLPQARPRRDGLVFLLLSQEYRKVLLVYARATFPLGYVTQLATKKVNKPN